MEEEIRRRKEGVPSVKTKREAAEGGRRHAEGVKAKFEWGGGCLRAGALASSWRRGDEGNPPERQSCGRPAPHKRTTLGLGFRD